MSAFRFVFILSLISLLPAPALLFISFNSSLSGYEKLRGGYAVLSTDTGIDDREIIELLIEGRKNFGGNPVSESTQWVMLDTFGSLEKIPLDYYFTRINSFDPRNDGYAEKLKNVFFKDGKRFIYIPLNAGNWNSAVLDRQFNNLLDGIPFSVDYYGAGEPLFLYFISYAAASLCLLVICYIKRKTHHGTAGIITLVPALSSLAFFGAPGIACSALLFGFFFLFREPLNELANQKMVLVYKEVIKPYKLYWPVLPLLLIALGTIVIFSRVRILFLLAVFVVSVFVFFFSSKLLSAVGGSVSGGEHRRFNPVMIIKRRLPDFAYSVYLIPFAIAVFFVMMFTMLFSPYLPAVSGRKINAIVEEQDYYAHLTYQSTFSTRQIGTGYLDFPSFTIDQDGLPIPANISQNQNVNLNSFPPFPLKHLMDFFQGVGGVGFVGGIAEKISFAVLLLMIIPGFLTGRKTDQSRKIDLSSSKKVSKIRLMGNKRNKTNTFKNNSSLRKDA